MVISNLISHTSGFGYDVWDPVLIRWRNSTGTSINCNSFSFESLQIPLKFQPGEDWVYGIGLDWAGHVIECLTGLSLEDYMQSKIFKPLGMTRTTFRISEHSELGSARASMGIRAHPHGTVVIGTNYKPDITPMDCGGVGLYSTATDYGKLLGALLNGGGTILKPETVHELLNWQLPSSKFVQDQFFGDHHHIFAPEFLQKVPVTYGLCGAINQVDIPEKRRAGSVMWHGIANCRWVRSFQASIICFLWCWHSTRSGLIRSRELQRPYSFKCSLQEILLYRSYTTD